MPADTHWRVYASTIHCRHRRPKWYKGKNCAFFCNRFEHGGASLAWPPATMLRCQRTCGVFVFACRHSHVWTGHKRQEEPPWTCGCVRGKNWLGRDQPRVSFAPHRGQPLAIQNVVSHSIWTRSFSIWYVFVYPHALHGRTVIGPSINSMI